MFNDTHVVDLAEIDGDEDTGGDFLREVKVPTPFLKKSSAGRVLRVLRRPRRRRRPPDAGADLYGFGSTEECRTSLSRSGECSIGCARAAMWEAQGPKRRG